MSDQMRVPSYYRILTYGSRGTDALLDGDVTAYTVKFVGGREDAPRDGASAPETGAVEPIGVVGDDGVPF